MSASSHSATPSDTLSLRACLIIATVLWIDIWFVAAIQYGLVGDRISGRGSAPLALIAVNCALMLGPLWAVGACSWRVGYELSQWRRLIVLHTMLALAFGIFARPASLISSAILSDAVTVIGFLREDLAHAARALLAWGAATIESAAQYLVIQSILAGAAHYVRLRAERTLRERLAGDYDRARLQALRAQTNPHFLFNTLSAIAGLIRTKPDAAEEMVTRLGELFRATLDDRDTEFIPLRRELELGEQYLEIQRARFDRRFGYRVECDPGLYDALIPPLLLQPLLENSAEHGLSGSEGQVDVAVICRREPGDLLAICVSNRVSSHSPGKRRAAQGFGLESVGERVKAAYGEAATFVAESRQDGWFEARLQIPMRLASEEDR